MTFQPSQIVITIPPLGDTMGKCEREVAAALLVLTCELLGDAWGPVTIEQVALAVAHAIKTRQIWSDMATNPFLKPDFHSLAKHGFARWSGIEGKGALELTAEGLERLSRWAPGGKYGARPPRGAFVRVELASNLQTADEGNPFAQPHCMCGYGWGNAVRYLEFAHAECNLPPRYEPAKPCPQCDRTGVVCKLPRGHDGEHHRA